MKKKVSITDLAAYIIFTIMVFIGAFRHEMWFDEAEAWVIVRDNRVSNLWNVLKTEGHPFLWYFILKIFAFLGFSANIVPFISAFVTVLTSGFIILKSPFSKYMNYLILFSSGFLYFNAVISRVYCIITLLLLLIADVYPDRKKHPVYYGILIAMLTNTHVCICGIVVVLGTEMFYDLIKEIKGRKASKKSGLVGGFVIALGGVLVLFITLLGSLSSNAEISSGSMSFSDRLSRAVLTFYDIPVLLSLPEEITFVSEIICIIYTICFVLLIFLLRSNKFSLALLLSFYIFYVIICGIIWYTIPNRAAIVYFVFVFVYWISFNSKNNEDTSKIAEIKADTRVIRCLFYLLGKLDTRPLYSIQKILCVLFALTIPTGLIYLFSDYFRDFSYEKAAACFIKNNYSSDSTVIITDTDAYPQLSCYLPDYTFYSVYLGEEYTYHDHSVSYEKMMSMYDELEFRKYLEHWDKILYVDANSADDDALAQGIVKFPGKEVFSRRHSMKYATKYTNVFVAEVSADELTDYFE